MKSYNYLFSIISLATMLLYNSCEEVPDVDIEDTTPVVEGFIYANRPVENIAIKEVRSFGSEDENEQFLSGLDLIINWEGQNFELAETDTLPGRYYYPGSDLQVAIGSSYELQFEFEGRLVSGTTLVPQAPIGLAISLEEIVLTQIDDFSDVFEFFQNNEIEQLVEWDNPNGDYYYLVIENIEEDPESLDPDEVLNFNFEFTTEPTQDEFFNIRPFAHYSQFGTHRVILYRVNEEYALLYESLEQDSRDLNEPFSNITNGVGVFSGFASDTVYFEIAEQ